MPATSTLQHARHDLIPLAETALGVASDPIEQQKRLKFRSTSKKGVLVEVEEQIQIPGDIRLAVVFVSIEG
jgi:hypothetical protein